MAVVPSAHSFGLALLALALAACGKGSEPHVFVLNGLDIPVTVAISSEGGAETVEVPPHGRATPDVSGKATVKVTSAAGEVISESEAQFGRPGGSPGCYRIFNVMGAAAYVDEDVVYGTGFGKPEYRRRAGEITEDECGISFAFRAPPESIAVDQYGPAGDNRGWLHDDGDGGWVVAVNSLLDDNGPYASQSRGAAQRIVRAVVTHDPNNPALAAIKDRLTQLALAVPASTPGNLLAQPARRHR
jgi:hypothetical protein